MKYIKKFESSKYTTLSDSIFDVNDKNSIKMIDAGYDINEIDNLGRTPLIWCALQKGVSVEVAKKLLEKGAKINTPDNDGYTALMNAADRKNYLVLYALLDADADWNIASTHEKLDFLDFLDSDIRQKIINKYPEKYQDYLMKKEADNYNL